MRRRLEDVAIHEIENASIAKKTARFDSRPRLGAVERGV